jgi:hypothetical protein
LKITWVIALLNVGVSLSGLADDDRPLEDGRVAVDELDALRGNVDDHAARPEVVGHPAPALHVRDELLDAGGWTDVQGGADHRADAAVVLQAMRLLERLHRDHELGIELVRLRLQVARVLARRSEARAQGGHGRIGVARADRGTVGYGRPSRAGVEDFPVRGEGGAERGVLAMLRR